MRSAIVKASNREAPVAFRLRASTPENAGYNRTEVKKLLDEGNFTCPVSPSCPAVTPALIVYIGILTCYIVFGSARRVI